ncbi:MAG TPA: hypothetical protein PLI48_04060 [Gammaproteobacteria bacterium]|nr:hypothetical protein [Gammaproteobacteria bacterium]HRP86582.1 hypothetical protein [Gammaproteobacteria bacterium]
MIAGLFANWRFRSSRPVFTPGEEIRAYLTGFDPATGEGTARIGDTVLTIKGCHAAQLDRLVELQIEHFDAGRGTARLAHPHAVD